MEEIERLKKKKKKRRKKKKTKNKYVARGASSSYCFAIEVSLVYMSPSSGMFVGGKESRWQTLVLTMSLAHKPYYGWNISRGSIHAILLILRVRFVLEIGCCYPDRT